VCVVDNCPKNKPVSVCFALDESGSVCSIGTSRNCDDLQNNAGEENAQCDYLNNCPKFNNSTKTFAKDIITSINGVSGAEFSVVTFATNSNIDTGLTSMDTSKSIIDALEYSGGQTNTQAAIVDCRRELTSAPEGNVKYIVMITDGLPTQNKNGNPVGNPCNSCIQEAREEADIAKGLGITLITIGVESVSFDPEFLEELSSPGQNFMVDNYDELRIIEESVSSATNICVNNTLS